jgi:hypothetical protein
LARPAAFSQAEGLGWNARAIDRVAGDCWCDGIGARARCGRAILSGQDGHHLAAFPAGGSYDAYARSSARHLGKHPPGAPSVIVNNMPGAGSNIAAADAARVAAKDGTCIAAPDAARPLHSILEDGADLNYDQSP